MTTLHVYVCSQCGHTQVREMGKIYTAEVPAHCGFVMQMSPYRPQDDDAYTQEQESGVFAIYCFDGEQWSVATVLPREETEQTVHPMHFLFEHEQKRYYRPVQVSSNPYGGISHADIVASLDPKNWVEESTTLSTPTFEARIDSDGTLWLSGVALREGFSVEAAQALTRFLSDHVKA